MTTRLRWYGDRIGRELEHAARTAVQRAGAHLMTQARMMANRPAKRERRRRQRTTSAGPKGSTYTHYIASAPGQPPAVRTGFGRRNIDMEFYPKRLIARVGVRESADYMIYLELGTRRIAPRPWLKPATDRSRASIEAIMRTALAQGTR